MAFLPVWIGGDTKTDPFHAKQLIRFTLFNYDRIIRDHFEGDHGYTDYLASLLCNATGMATEASLNVVNNPTLYNESTPVGFMMRLNTTLKQQSGHYFINN